MPEPLPGQPGLYRACPDDDALLEWVAARHAEAPLAWDQAWAVDPDMLQGTRGLLHQQLAAGVGIVLVAGEAPAPDAWCALVWAFTPEAVGMAPQPVPSWHLASLWVDPEHRGTGLAGRLLGALEAQARARGIVRLTSEVHARNRAMLVLQQQWGHRVVGREGEWTHFAKDLSPVATD